MIIKLVNHMNDRETSFVINSDEDLQKTLAALGMKLHQQFDTLEKNVAQLVKQLNQHHTSAEVVDTTIPLKRKDIAKKILETIDQVKQRIADKYDDPWVAHKMINQSHHLPGLNRKHAKSDADELHQQEMYHAILMATLSKSVSKGASQDKQIFEQVIGTTPKPAQGPLEGDVPKTSLAQAYRSYKNSPGNHVARGLKFIVHRIENRDAYTEAAAKGPEHVDAMDQALVEHMSAGQSGRTSLEYLRHFVHTNPSLVTAVLKHQRQLHTFLQTKYPHIIENGKIALTRGLNVPSRDKVGPEHPLSSYGDVGSTGFGGHMYHNWVPLNNIWYSFMTGPKSATSENHGNENEWLVSPHKWEEAKRSDVKTALSRDEGHSFADHPSKYAFMYLKPEDFDTLGSDVASDRDEIYNNARFAAKNKLATPSFLKTFLKAAIDEQHTEGIKTALTHPNMDATTLNELAAKDDSHTAYIAAAHPKTDKRHAIQQLMRVPVREQYSAVRVDDAYRSGLFERPDYTAEDIQAIADNAEKFGKRDIAMHMLSHPNTSDKTLRSWFDRLPEPVAAHPNTSGATVLDFMDRKASSFRAKEAVNAFHAAQHRMSREEILQAKNIIKNKMPMDVSSVKEAMKNLLLHPALTPKDIDDELLDQPIPVSGKEGNHTIRAMYDRDELHDAASPLLDIVRTRKDLSKDMVNKIMGSGNLGLVRSLFESGAYPHLIDEHRNTKQHDIMWAMTHHPDLPVDVQNHIVDHGDSVSVTNMVRLTKHPDVILRALAKEGVNEFVKAAAQKNKNINKSDLPPPPPPIEHQVDHKLYEQYKKPLEALAHLESTGHIHRTHNMVNVGVHKGTQSISSYGLMPIQAYEVASKDKQFANSTTGKAVLAAAGSDPKANWRAIASLTAKPALDKEAAAHMWDYNQKRLKVFAAPHHNLDALGAYAHRNGVSATFKMLQSDDGYQKILSSPYVATFLKKMGLNLQKTLHPDDVRKLNNDVSKEGADTVDHMFHANASEGKIPQHINDVLYGNAEAKRVKKMDISGVAKKAVYDDPTTGRRFMFKAYHSKPESGTKSYVKSHMKGWATMATRGLYEAAGIGHLCEDVHTGIHDGTPVTVHHFAEGVPIVHLALPSAGSKSPVVREAWDKKRNTGEFALNLAKINLMDFLTNNCDRHNGNLIITKDGDPLAIDHERSFQYRKTPQLRFRAQPFPTDSLSEYWKNTGLETAISEPNILRHARPHSDVAWYVGDWFNQNYDNLHQEMDKHLGAIKDERLRQHVGDNFRRKMEFLKTLFERNDDGTLHSEVSGDVNLFRDTGHHMLLNRLISYPRGKKNV